MLDRDVRVGQVVQVRADVTKYYLYHDQTIEGLLPYLRGMAKVLSAPPMPRRDSEELACAYGEYPPRYRFILRQVLLTPRCGVVVGWTMRYAGELFYDSDGGWISSNTNEGVRVWRVMCGNGNRWAPPIDAIADDITLIEDGSNGKRK
jgi:hypothetical protein